MTNEEAEKIIIQVADTLKQALYEECTCYSDIDKSCRFCGLMLKTDKLMKSIPKFSDI